MLSEKEFNLIRLVSTSSFLEREEFSSDNEYNFICELALDMYSRNALRSQLKGETRPVQGLATILWDHFICLQKLKARSVLKISYLTKNIIPNRADGLWETKSPLQAYLWQQLA